MSNRILPIAGITAVLAVGSYFGLSLLFPAKKEIAKNEGVSAEQVFAAEANPADLPPEPATGAETAPEAAPEADGAAVPTEETPVAEAPAEAMASEAAADPVATAPAPAVEEAAPAAEAPVTEAAPAPASTGLSRDELARIVAEAAARSAAETAKAIAEQAARQSAGR